MAFILGFTSYRASSLFAMCVIIIAISGATGQTGTIRVAFDERSPIVVQRNSSASLTCIVSLVSGRSMLPMQITYTVEIEKIAKDSADQGQVLTRQLAVVAGPTKDPDHYQVSMLTGSGDTSRLSFQLVINKVSEEDVAKYRCRASRKSSEEVGRDSIDLVLPGIPPSINCTNYTVPPTADHVRLTCIVSHQYLTIRDTLWQLTSGGDALLSNNFTEDNVTQLMNNPHESLVSLELKIKERREGEVAPNTIFRKQGGSTVTLNVTVHTDAGVISQNVFLTLAAPKVEPKENGSSMVTPMNAACSTRLTALSVVMVTLLNLLVACRAADTGEGLVHVSLTS